MDIRQNHVIHVSGNYRSRGLDLRIERRNFLNGLVEAAHILRIVTKYIGPQQQFDACSGQIILRHFLRCEDAFDSAFKDQMGKGNGQRLGEQPAEDWRICHIIMPGHSASRPWMGGRPQKYQPCRLLRVIDRKTGRDRTAVGMADNDRPFYVQVFEKLRNQPRLAPGQMHVGRISPLRISMSGPVNKDHPAPSLQSVRQRSLQIPQIAACPVDEHHRQKSRPVSLPVST